MLPPCPPPPSPSLHYQGQHRPTATAGAAPLPPPPPLFCLTRASTGPLLLPVLPLRDSLRMKRGQQDDSRLLQRLARAAPAPAPPAAVLPDVDRALSQIPGPGVCAHAEAPKPLSAPVMVSNPSSLGPLAPPAAAVACTSRQTWSADTACVSAVSIVGAWLLAASLLLPSRLLCVCWCRGGWQDAVCPQLSPERAEVPDRSSSAGWAWFEGRGRKATPMDVLPPPAATTSRPSDGVAGSGKVGVGMAKGRPPPPCACPCACASAWPCVMMTCCACSGLISGGKTQLGT